MRRVPQITAVASSPAADAHLIGAVVDSAAAAAAAVVVFDVADGAGKVRTAVTTEQ